MIFAVTVLRAIAAILITNAHYTGVYPIELIANGGMLGDVLFFAVSGYCLFNVKDSFPVWYGKRCYRVYPPVMVITLVYILLGVYSLKHKTMIQWLIYPTNYHFIASIIVLYIPYYFILKIKHIRNRLPYVMISIGIIWIVLYMFVYDKSYYHIDNVYEPMVRILFFEAMMLGAWFRSNDRFIRGRIRVIDYIGTGVFVVLYFVTKLMFAGMKEIAAFQFVNQIIIFMALYFMFKTVLELDDLLNKLPGKIKRILCFIAEHTLEIYVVQYVLIDKLRGVSVFPVNWIILTCSIMSSAFVLHIICKGFYRMCNIFYNRLSKDVKFETSCK